MDTNFLCQKKYRDAFVSCFSLVFVFLGGCVTYILWIRRAMGRLMELMAPELWPNSSPEQRPQFPPEPEAQSFSGFELRTLQTDV
jgi:hypothetical protein